MKTKMPLAAAILLTAFTSAGAQYQKMDNSQFLSASGAPHYVAASWSKMLTNKTYLSISQTYFTTSARQFSTDNLLTELAFGRAWLRLSDVYLNGGFGGFLMYTTSKTIASTTIDDISGGFDLKAEIEYLPLWWLAAVGEVRQLIFIASDFYNTRFLYGVGVRVYF